jgi:hypothetical protein
VDPLNPGYSDSAGILFDKNQTVLIRCPGAYNGPYAIPDSVTNLAANAFSYCANLTAVTLVGMLRNISTNAFYQCTSLTHVSIGSSVTNIAYQAFYRCTSLTNIVISGSVTNIAASAFGNCSNLEGVYFQANAPKLGAGAFAGDSKATVYYVPGTTNWGATFGNRPALLWNPTMQPPTAGSVTETEPFTIAITGTTYIPIVIEASTNLTAGSWSALQSCRLTNGSIFFNDADWTNYRSRLYRIRSP